MKTENEIITAVDNMCIESLEPVFYEKWEEVKSQLQTNRRLLGPHSMKEKVFTETEISHLQTRVHKVTGDGEVMILFNELLGVQANQQP